AYFNPGALGMTPHRTQLYFGSTAVWPTTQYLAQWPSIYQASSESVLQTPVNLYASWRPKLSSNWNRFSLGLSVNNPFVSSIRWPLDWRGRFIAQEFDLNTFFIQPTLSYRVSEQIGFGVGLVYGYGTLSSQRALQVDGQNGTVSSARFTATGGGVGVNVGLYLKTDDNLTFGINWRSGPRLQMPGGDAQFQVPESLQESYPDMKLEAEVPLPWSLSVGMSLRPEERLLLTFQLDYTAWQAVDSLRIQLAQPINGLDLYQDRNFSRGMNLRMGGEYVFNEWLKMRAGGYYDASPVPQNHVSPEFPDANRIGLTAGIGLALGNKVQLDVAYQFAFTGERTAFFEPAVFSGTYETNTSALGLGLQVSLGKQK
ncbi:MAG: outer membrane protein transport protein, partial [Bacteroidota bacterium]